MSDGLEYSECPECGAEVYDNRQKVDNGWKGPLWKCRAGCGWVKWAPKGQRRQGGGPGGQTARVPNGPKWTWGQLSGLYEKCLLIAGKHLEAHVPEALPADIVAATATLFIAATRDGVKPTGKPAEPPPPPPPPPPPAPDAHLDEEDDDLPF